MIKKRRLIFQLIAITFFLGFFIPFHFIKAACPLDVDVVFINDSSGSMWDERNTLCNVINTVITGLSNMGFHLNYRIYVLSNSNNLVSLLPCEQDRLLYNSCGGNDTGDNEMWGPAVAERAQNYPWRPGATRIIIPISDEGPYCGDGCNVDDTNSITNAINAANANNVFVFPIQGNGASACCSNNMDALVAGTNANDKKFLFSGNANDMARDISNAIIMAVWDSDQDCFVPADCPCDPNNPPTNPNCPGGVMGCNDAVDTNSCINPSSTEAMLPADPWQCNSIPSVATLFGIRQDYICNFEYFKYDCGGLTKGVCAVNCGDNYDNNQNGYVDKFDKSCPLAGGIVPCGRERDDATTPEFENCPCRLCHLFVLVDRIIKFALFKIVVPLAVLMIVIGGIMFLTAGGNPERISSSKKLMTNVAIGILIIFAAWIIVNTILMLIGVADWTGLKEGWWQIECPVPGVCCKYQGSWRIPCFKSVNEPCKLPWEP
jgi:hypothetical protein